MGRCIAVLPADKVACVLVLSLFYSLSLADIHSYELRTEHLSPLLLSTLFHPLSLSLSIPVTHSNVHDKTLQTKL